MLFVVACASSKKASSDFSEQTDVVTERVAFRVMFYNVENLFDTEDDSLTNDNEFLPDQGKYWTPKKYQTKLNHIYQVITAIGGWELPEVIGLCEIENRKVLDDLINRTPLYRAGFEIVHYESPDSRGIDVAFLYRKEYFTVDYSRPIHVNFPKSMGKTTRDILYVKGRDNSNDTLHIFINHWPSRWGGQMETEEKRMFCASVVKDITDSIMRAQLGANIIICGDLNDHPTDRSLLESLATRTSFENIRNKSLYNLSYYLQEVKGLGSHKYQGHWGVLDQIIVSGGLLDKNSSLYTTPDDAHIFKEDFLLVDDEKYTGKELYRTYLGYKYIGGYSDHLPVYLDLYKK
jgi:predicted extracellular nuclease